MRDAFVQELEEIASADERIFLIVGDLGYGVIESFERKFPNRFINAGVAEQNMIGIAAGLASLGFKPFVYSIANFPVFRCLEQIRNDVCYQQLDVTIISIGAGLSYGSLGYSHYLLEDIGVMRSLPGMTIYSPADSIETRIALRHSMNFSGPKYFRIGKSKEVDVYVNTKTSFPKHTFLASGKDLLIISTGSIVNEAIKADEILRSIGIEVSIVHIPILKPLNIDSIDLKPYREIVILEEHSIFGGLTTLVSEHLAKNRISSRLTSLSLPDSVSHEIGTQIYLRKHYGIDSSRIVEVVKVLASAPANKK
jgi:transketolase